MADLRALIKQGEGISVEFKECRRTLNLNVYKTVCAFLNRHGGTLLLGVSDAGEVIGVDPGSVEQMKKDFVTAINNPQKINPPAYLLIDDVEVEGKMILRIYVPESSQVHRCNGRIFDRNEDGDFDITDYTRQVADLYHRKQATYSENKIYPFAGLADLRTDLILRKVNLDRYDDRDFVTTNLIESYERIIAFIQKHLPDPFYLEGMDRISIRDAIFREVASNILIHREYRNAFPAKLIIERGLVRTENSNKPHGFGTLNLSTFTPFPKNPVIAAFFREIHRADELGSGMRNMMKYGKAYGGEDPEMIEGDVFRTIIKYPDSAVYEEDSTATGGAAPQVTPQVTPQVIRLLNVLKEGEVNRGLLMEKLGLHDRKSFGKNYLLPALEQNLIEMTQPDSPKSPTQKYRLTDAGKHLLKSVQE